MKKLDKKLDQKRLFFYQKPANLLTKNEGSTKAQLQLKLVAFIAHARVYKIKGLTLLQLNSINHFFLFENWSEKIKNKLSRRKKRHFLQIKITFEV